MCLSIDLGISFTFSFEAVCLCFLRLEIGDTTEKLKNTSAFYTNYSMIYPTIPSLVRLKLVRESL
jgi:hypothetical protein